MSERAVQHYKACRFRDLQTQAAKVLAGESASARTMGDRLSDAELTDEQRARHLHRRPDPKRDSPEQLMAKLGVNYEAGDALMNAQQMGLCAIHAAPGDFVRYLYLCDRWAEKFRPDGAEKADELPGEARERIYGEDK